MLTIVSQLGFTNVGIAPTSSLGTQADLSTAFDTYDINKDGYITRTQFGDLLSFIGINIGKPRVRVEKQIRLANLRKFRSFSRRIPLILDLFHDLTIMLLQTDELWEIVDTDGDGRITYGTQRTT